MTVPAHQHRAEGSRASPRGLIVALLLVIASCTGNADLGSEPVILPPPSAMTDAGQLTAPVTPPMAADAAAMMMSDAGPLAAPLELTFRSAGADVGSLRIQCPDTCASIELSARGGSPPYAFTWDDASTDATRQFCPSADATLQASVRDADGTTRSAALVVQLAACVTGHLCADNASFEGKPSVGAEWLLSDFDAAPWQACRDPGTDASSAPKVVARASGDEFPAPSDGESYLYLESNPPARGFVGQPLCAGLARGSAYSFKFDLAYAAENRTGVQINPGQLEVYASSNACQRDELLWTSPHLTTGFRTYCVTLKPTRSATALILNPIGPSSGAAAVFIDHLVAVDSCP